MASTACDLWVWQREASERGVAVDLLDQYAVRPPKHRGFAIGLGLIPVEDIDPAIASLAASAPV